MDDWNENYSYNRYYDNLGLEDRIGRLSGGNEEIETRIRRNILSVEKAHQEIDFGSVILSLVFIAVGWGSRLLVRGALPESPLSFYVSLITAIALVVVYRLTKNNTYGCLRDMVGAWYMFAQVGLLMNTTYFQAYYYGLNCMEDLKSFIFAVLTWVAVIICVVVVYKSTAVGDVEVNPFIGYDLKKVFEWQKIRKQHDRKYGLLRDLFMIPMIYSFLKFFACIITNILMQLGGKDNVALSDSIGKFLELISYIDWGLVCAFCLLAVIYSIRFMVNKEKEKETTEYIDVNSTLFDE